MTDTPPPDPAALAPLLLKSCGGARLLVLGTGAAGLVPALLRQGLDAHGLAPDAAAAEAGERRTPGRWRHGPVQALPYPERDFDTVAWLDAPEDLPDPGRALAELRRVARRAVFLTPATGARGAWEARAIAAGFRKHPLYLRAVPFPDLDRPGAPLALEPVADGEPLPPPGIDMLRESGRLADAHAARYELAAEMVGPGQRVLDLACGGGWGLAILAHRTEAARFVGFDTDPAALAYARHHFTDPRLEFRAPADPEAGGFDVVVAFDVPEMLAAAARWLRPGGRLVAGVVHHGPGNWADFRARFTEPLAIDRQFTLKAGGGPHEPDAPRELLEVDPDRDGSPLADFALVVAVKSPFVAVGPAAIDPADRAARAAAEPYPVHAWWRDYDNPWLVESFVNHGSRVRNPRLLAEWAERIAREARPGSPDQGAALCVQAYRLLERPDLPWAEAEARLGRIAAYLAAADDSAHGLRWRVSLHFAAGRLWLAGGFLAPARDAFAACAAIDVRPFSTTLGTKTVAAALEAGRISLTLGEPEAARRWWRHGLTETNRLLQGDGTAIWGPLDAPFWVETREVAEVLDLAVECATALTSLDGVEHQPALIHEKRVWGRGGQVGRLHQLEREMPALRSEIVALQLEGRDLRHANTGLRADVALREGLLRLERNRPAAEAWFARARALAPERTDHALPRLLLAHGHLPEGWSACERRPAPRTPPPPVWQGEDLSGKRIRVRREPGLGEELLFASCYGDLIARAGHVVIDCDPRLAGLFARSFPQATVRPDDGTGTDVPADLQVPAGSLPRFLRPDLASFPRHAGYLVPDPARVAAWRGRLGPGPWVGISWRGRYGAGLFPGLEHWAPVLSVPGVRFVTLQYDPREAEIAEAERRFGIAIVRPRLDNGGDLDLTHDLEGVAALTAALDRVVTAPVSAGDLAGALGVPVWRFGWDDDWATLGTDHRPWYPSMRLFYAPTGAPLEDVLAALGAELRGGLGG